MKDFVLDASLALQWFLDDEVDRAYSLAVLGTLSDQRAIVPTLWFYEVGNGLLMACRRKRITIDQSEEFLARLRDLPIRVAPETPADILELPKFAQVHRLSNYDAAYLALALRQNLPLATTDGGLRAIATSLGVKLLTP